MLLQAALEHLDSAKALFNTSSKSYESAGYLSNLGLSLIFQALVYHKTNKSSDETSLFRLIKEVNKSGFSFKFDKNRKKTIKNINSFDFLRYHQTTVEHEVSPLDWEEIETITKYLLENLPEEITMEIKNMPGGAQWTQF